MQGKRPPHSSLFLLAGSCRTPVLGSHLGEKLSGAGVLEGIPKSRAGAGVRAGQLVSRTPWPLGVQLTYRPPVVREALAQENAGRAQQALHERTTGGQCQERSGGLPGIGQPLVLWLWAALGGGCTAASVLLANLPQHAQMQERGAVTFPRSLAPVPRVPRGSESAGCKAGRAASWCHEGWHLRSLTEVELQRELRDGYALQSASG